MDKATVIGLALALAAIVGGQVLEGGHLSSLVQGTAFVIVILGTFGAVVLQSPVPVVVRGVRMLRWLLRPPADGGEPLVRQVMVWSNTARQGGLLALEPLLPQIRDPFLRRGLQMVVDGAEPERLREDLLTEVSAHDDSQRQAARIWEAAGGYAPTLGILGAVLGLIQVMENLAEPSRLGSGIATAFVATIYGVGSANLLFLPVAHKLKAITARQSLLREMAVEGLVGIVRGDNPRAIEPRLRAFLA